MKLLSYTKKKGEMIIDCFFCCKFLCKKKETEKTPKDENRERKKNKPPKDETMKKTKPPTDEIKKKKKKRKLFCFGRKKKLLCFGRTKKNKTLKDAKEKEKEKKRNLCLIKRKKQQPLKDEKEKNKKKKPSCLFKRKEENPLKDEDKKKKKKNLFLCRRKKKPQKDEKKKNKTSTDEKKKKAWRKRKLRRFWRRKKGQKKGNHLASLVKSISFKSDSGKHRSAAEEILRIGSDNIAARVFSYRQLAAATRNFSPENLLGEGGFGRVYKGQLKDTNEIVAVKQLDRQGFQGNREFLVEVLMLSLLHHPNLVKLLGYCADGDQRILVYEYMPLGSLEDRLLELKPNIKPLDWYARMKIAAGAARGLEYLHEIATPPVIYRDFKASNILLDENYNPKLSDFGLAKVGPSGDKTHVSTRVMGTYGYCAPEYALTGKLTKMSDVYSFGVVFLELITGRKAIDMNRPKREQHLVHWAEPLLKDRRQFPTMADPLLQGRFPIKGLYQALAVAAMCLQEEGTIRPLIGDVLTALEYLANPKNDEMNSSIGPVPQNMPISRVEVIPQNTIASSPEIVQDNEVSEEILESHSYPEVYSFSSREDVL